ncbi:MAG: ABC transporter substrate-binding protein [Iphinoe sp. HA4291-MV1]|jgi:NitT/TauT family transport system substrate-binding protein|nr:ABC transporter substrate-binding protein [Iphinoe sp. HA4291-MV1]
MSKQKKGQLWTRRQAIWLVTGLTGSLALDACTQKQSSQSSQSTTSTSAARVSAALGASPWIGNTPLYIALEKGFFTKRGLDLKNNIFSSSLDQYAAFSAGQLQVTGAAAIDAVALASREPNFRIVMVFDASRGADGILARNKIASIADFKGKEIAVEIASASHFFLLRVLEQAGLTEKDVRIINTTTDAAAASYQAGKVDIAVTYAPFLQKVNQATKDGRVIYDSSKTSIVIEDVYLFNTKFIESNPTAIQAFVDGIEEGKKFLQTNRKEGLAIAGKQLQLTKEAVEEQLQGVELPTLEKNREMLGNPNSNIYLGKHLEDVAKFLVNQKIIKEVPKDLAKLLEPKFVQVA